MIVFRYKAEAVMECDPETVFYYVDPVPDGPRAKWDRAVKALELVDRLDKVTINFHILLLVNLFSFTRNPLTKIFIFKNCFQIWPTKSVNLKRKLPPFSFLSLSRL